MTLSSLKSLELSFFLGQDNKEDTLVNILFLAPRFHTNQVDLVSKLIEEGHNVSFLVMRKGPTEDYSTLTPYVVGPSWLSKVINRIAKRPVPCFGRTHGLPNLVRLYRRLKLSKANVAIIRDIRSGYGLLSLPYLLLSGTRVAIYTQRPKYEDGLTPYLRLFYFVLFKILKFRGFTTVKHRFGYRESEGTNTPFEYVPFFKRVNPMSSSRSYNTSEPRLLAIGKFEPGKNFFLLLEVFKQLSKTHSCTLTLVGECSLAFRRQYYDKVKAFIEENNLRTKVSLLVDQPYKKVQNLYLEHDIFIIPAIRETASISQIEAMAHGLPVICSDDNGTAHYVKHNVNGFVVKADNDNLYKAIAYFFENPQMIKAFGSKSVELLETEFNIEEAYDKFMNIIS